MDFIKIEEHEAKIFHLKKLGSKVQKTSKAGKSYEVYDCVVNLDGKDYRWSPFSNTIEFNKLEQGCKFRWLSGGKYGKYETVEKTIEEEKKITDDSLEEIFGDPKLGETTEKNKETQSSPDWDEINRKKLEDMKRARAINNACTILANKAESKITATEISKLAEVVYEGETKFINRISL